MELVVNDVYHLKAAPRNYRRLKADSQSAGAMISSKNRLAALDCYVTHSSGLIDGYERLPGSS
jgi:hypothetical protein